MTHYLRFPDQLEFRILCAQAEMLTEDNALITATHTYAVDEIGIITHGGAWDPETGEQLEAPVTLPGWHVNLIGDLPTGWQPYVVQPLHPVRVFAGVEALLAS
jgi:hypothetical protein